MARKMVPFGTDIEEFNFTKGVIIVYDSFDDLDDTKLEKIIEIADSRDFDKVIFYPLHEKTARRMGINYIRTCYKDRIKFLQNFINNQTSDVTIEICKLEGKRSKYTPIDTALSFISEYQQGPYFMWTNDYIANQFATFSTFDKWIREVRLMIHKEQSLQLEAKLLDKKNRWEFV